MPSTPRVSLERILEVAERFYARDGFCRWSDVGKAVGVSRQAIQLRLKAAVEKGLLAPETVERLQSMSSRAAATRERRTQQKVEDSKHRLRIQLTPENHTWLLEEAAFRKATTADIVNGLLTRAREAAAQQS